MGVANLLIANSRMQIEAAERAKKTNDGHGAQFVLGWRLYPNKDHLRQGGEVCISCG